MALYEIVEKDIKTAMLAKEKDKLEALRAIKAAFLLAKTEKGAADVLSDDTEFKILSKMVKQRRETAEIYQQQNRKDLADKELLEADVIAAYLPKMLDASELEAILRGIIQLVGAVSAADMGKVMGAASKELSGKAEGKAISDMVKKLLS